MTTIKIGNYELHSKEVQSISNKNYIKYNGLLRLAHKKGITSMTVEKITKVDDTVICHVRVKGMTDNTYFDGIGTGSPDNLKTMTKIYPFEMAQTRAKARALRDFLNIGEVSAEEMPDYKLN